MAANILPCYYGKGSYSPRGLVDHYHKKHGGVLKADKKQCKKCRNFFKSAASLNDHKCPVNTLAGGGQGSGGGGHGTGQGGAGQLQVLGGAGQGQGGTGQEQGGAGGRGARGRGAG